MKKVVFIFLFISLYSFAQNKQKVDLSTPNATLYTHIYYLMPENYDVAKSATTIKDLPRGEAQVAAKKIKEIFDGNGLIIDFSKVPVNANYIDTVNFGVRTMEHNANRYAPFPIRLPQVYLEILEAGVFNGRIVVGLIGPRDRVQYLQNRLGDFYRGKGIEPEQSDRPVYGFGSPEFFIEGMAWRPRLE